ncbi:hypothetical protein TWF694_011628 [Orbilia ellipsospora]|uniref:Uncharacterized protein n=1 Tax=Orbilia ellipsospora TaxID=2528407 RepID=A0AAV9X8Q4_9PEZI
MADSIFDKLKKLGILSLLSYIIGSTILGLVSINCILGPTLPSQIQTQTTPLTSYIHLRGFKENFGLSLQSWLVIVSIGISSSLYGHAIAWTHYFNSSCSRAVTKSTKGLDYGRYLNSLSDAPVLIGWHGFRGMLLAKYILMASGVALTVGYKFALQTVPATTTEAIDISNIILAVPPFDGIANNTATPLLLDSVTGRQNRAFVFVNGSSKLTGPEQIIMASVADCNDQFKADDEGVLSTKEIVMVANRYIPAGPFYMNTSRTGQRERTSSSNWDRDSSSIVEFDSSGPGKVWMQWTPFFGGWDCSFNCTDRRYHLVTEKILYNLTYAVAVVNRKVSLGGCTYLLDTTDVVSIRYLRSADIEFEGETLPLYRNWVDAAVMSGWGQNIPNLTNIPTVGHLNGDIEAALGEGAIDLFPDDSNIGYGSIKEGTYPADAHDNIRRYYATPVGEGLFVGTRGGASVGCYFEATVVFIILAVLNLIILMIRIISGPPALTSWAGQHVYLVHGSEMSSKLGSGDGYTRAMLGQFVTGGAGEGVQFTLR